MKHKPVLLLALQISISIIGICSYFLNWYHFSWNGIFGFGSADKYYSAYDLFGFNFGWVLALFPIGYIIHIVWWTSKIQYLEIIRNILFLIPFAVLIYDIQNGFNKLSFFGLDVSDIFQGFEYFDKIVNYLNISFQFEIGYYLSLVLIIPIVLIKKVNP